MTPETPETRIKRLRMRSMRRGIKEMDIILMRYADRRLADLAPTILQLMGLPQPEEMTGKSLLT